MRPPNSRWLVPALALAIGLATPAARAAEDAEARPNAIQADLGLAVIGLAYERALGHHLAIQVEAQVFSTWFGPIFDLPNFTGAGGQIRPTVFPLGDAPFGLYIAPYFRVDGVTAEANGARGSSVGWSAGGFIGYSWRLFRVVDIRLGAGAQYLSYAVRAGATELAFRQAFPAIDIVVGYTF
jgi:hypothetical protein